MYLLITFNVCPKYSAVDNFVCLKIGFKLRRKIKDKWPYWSIRNHTKRFKKHVVHFECEKKNVLDSRFVYLIPVSLRLHIDSRNKIIFMFLVYIIFLLLTFNRKEGWNFWGMRLVNEITVSLDASEEVSNNIERSHLLTQSLLNNRKKIFALLFEDKLKS